MSAVSSPFSFHRVFSPPSVSLRRRVLPGQRTWLRMSVSEFLPIRGHALQSWVLKRSSYPPVGVHPSSFLAGSASSPPLGTHRRPSSLKQVHRRATCVCSSYRCVYSGVIECGPDFPCGVYTSTGMYCRYILTCDRVYCFYCNPEWRILLEGCCIPAGECNVLVGDRDILSSGWRSLAGGCREGFHFTSTRPRGTCKMYSFYSCMSTTGMVVLRS